MSKEYTVAMETKKAILLRRVWASVYVRWKPHAAHKRTLPSCVSATGVPPLQLLKDVTEFLHKWQADYIPTEGQVFLMTVMTR